MRRLLKYFFNFLASMNVAIFILSAIAILSILQAAGEKLVTNFGYWKWFKIITSIDFYHTKGFIALLILFGSNLIACSLKRLPKTINVLRYSSKELDEGIAASVPLVKRFKARDYTKSSEALSSTIAKHFKKPTFVKEEGGRLNLYAERGRYTHVGFYLAHLSILVIVIGVMLSTMGYEYSFEIRKGQVFDPLIVRDSEGRKKSLDFSLLCEDIKTTNYQGTSQVERHQSTLTILNDGEKIKTQVVDFGHSLRYQGIDIYQDRFSRKVKYAKIKVVSRDKGSEVYEVKSGSNFKLGDTGVSVMATRFRSNSLQLRSGSSPAKLWISHDPVRFSDKRLKDYQFSLVEILRKEETSLKVISDPGKGMVWCSFLSMVLGFGITFFLSHQRVWARVEGGEDECTVTLAGSASKDLHTIEELFNDIHHKFSEVQE